MTIAPKKLAQHLRQVAARLDLVGADALRLAPQLEARGWPTTTLGDGPRGTTNSSSTETAALKGPGPYENATINLNARLHYTWLVSTRLDELLEQLTAHADTTDPLPAGSGSCEACGHVCRPDMKKGDRIRSGFCPACYRAWLRDGQPERAPWIFTRGKELQP